MIKNGEFKGICKKCIHRKFCKYPCYPVYLYLMKDNQIAPEKIIRDRTGKQTGIMLPNAKKETRESSLHTDENNGTLANYCLSAFSTETPSPWKEFNPQLKQTRIFIDHFFNGFSYEDLAVMFDESVQEISNTHNHAVERLLRLLKYLDRKKQIHHYGTYIKKGK
jgi:hypothetical protein